MRSRRKSLRSIVRGAACAALLVILSQMSIPFPGGVPLTLQTFAVSLIGFVLGAKLGLLTVLLYVLLGAVGLPVFAGLKGGFPVLIGPTGGFIFGFLALAFLSGTGVRTAHGNILRFPALLSACAGLLICHLMGISQYAVLSGNPWGVSALLVSLPFLLKDVLSVVLAYASAKIIRQRLFSLENTQNAD